MARRNTATTSQKGRMSNARAGNMPIIQPGCSPVQAVLGQPELLEFILDFAIHDNDVETNLKTLRGVRLVNKSWLGGVTQTMRTNKEPMFKLMLTQENSLNGTPVVSAQGKLLDRFAKTIANRVMKKPFPTFSLEIMKNVFRRENFHSLVSFLRRCAEGLLELKMIIPENAGSLPGLLPIEDLPMLQKLFVVMFLQDRVAVNLSGRELDFGNSTNVICLIHSFLSKAKSLKVFSVPGLRDSAPIGFEILALPESITNLDLRCRITSDLLEVLTINKLPNLLELCLLLDNVSYTDGLLSKVLDNLSHLRRLIIYGIHHNGPPRKANFIRFPVMKRLTTLSINANNFELEDHHPMLHECFPKLNTLNIMHHTPEALRRWATGKPLDSVDCLSLSLMDENKRRSDSDYVLPVNLESMQSIHMSFPNVRELQLEMPSGTQACGLKYLFMEMQQLTCLKISVCGSESIINSDLWDSILTGAPLSVVTGLRENPDYWSHVELKGSAPCIKMLTELRTLRLDAFAKGIYTRAIDPIISDLSFKFALLKMPMLMNLYLYGRFKATYEMTETWKKQGRKLV